eukprot:scaffold26989_cov40-Prasinocladus_malaysianus.AAC.2
MPPKGKQSAKPIEPEPEPEPKPESTTNTLDDTVEECIDKIDSRGDGVIWYAPYKSSYVTCRLRRHQKLGACRNQLILIHSLTLPDEGCSCLVTVCWPAEKAANQYSPQA